MDNIQLLFFRGFLTLTQTCLVPVIILYRYQVPGTEIYSWYSDIKIATSNGPAWFAVPQHAVWVGYRWANPWSLSLLLNIEVSTLLNCRYSNINTVFQTGTFGRKKNNIFWRQILAFYNYLQRISEFLTVFQLQLFFHLVWIPLPCLTPWSYYIRISGIQCIYCTLYNTVTTNE
jgi:hypothetical protein